jgi:hypothetical protein
MGSNSDEELRVQKEEIVTRLAMSEKGGGECGLNARRGGKTWCARRLDHGRWRPHLW